MIAGGACGTASANSLLSAKIPALCTATNRSLNSSCGDAGGGARAGTLAERAPSSNAAAAATRHAHALAERAAHTAEGGTRACARLVPGAGLAGERPAESRPQPCPTWGALCGGAGLRVERAPSLEDRRHGYLVDARGRRRSAHPEHRGAAAAARQPVLRGVRPV